MTKDKIFHSKRTLNCNGKLLDLSTSAVMGILNLTDDSFYDGGKHQNSNKALKQITKMLDEGARIIDIGAYSSRPGAKNISEKEEWERLNQILPIVNKEFPNAIFSVDTFRAEIARKSVAEGVHMINDISAGELDPLMFDTIAELQVPYILMHMQGTPQNMQTNPQYNCIEEEVLEYFKKKTSILQSKGVKDLLIDPGFGFGKTLEHNYQLLKNMKELEALGLPIVAGVSRKSMIYKLLGNSPQEALNGSTVVHSLCLQQGANILRVHDVKEAIECIKIINFAEGGFNTAIQ